MEKLQVRDITKQYILTNYDIEHESQMREIDEYVGEFDPEFGEYSKEQLLEMIEDRFDSLKATYVNIGAAEGGLEIDFYKLGRIKETRDETIIRLQDEIKDKIRARIAEEKDRKLYEELKLRFED